MYATDEMENLGYFLRKHRYCCIVVLSIYFRFLCLKKNKIDLHWDVIYLGLIGYQSCVF
jgi:hypothetical protein